MGDSPEFGGVRIDFGVPSYNEGRTILPTLRSLSDAARACGMDPIRLILSDSSDTEETVETARFWAREANIDLFVDRSERRRSIKEAHNVIFDHADADILVILVADVVIDASSLKALLFELTHHPRPVVAIGCAAPDPAYRAGRYRASRWQINITRRTAGLIARDRPRPDGAFWGAWRSFYSGYRFPLGTGSIADDVELVRHLRNTGIPAHNALRALAYKVPAGTLEDFYYQTYRSFAATGLAERRPFFRALLAAGIEALRDPLGGLAFVHARIWSARRHRRSPIEFSEMWPVSESTKRDD
jgi:glycosyltransferase involved in cell wall biosynthesis